MSEGGSVRTSGTTGDWSDVKVQNDLTIIKEFNQLLLRCVLIGSTKTTCPGPVTWTPSPAVMGNTTSTAGRATCVWIFCQTIEYLDPI